MKNKKIIGAAIAATMLVSAACGLVACDKDAATPNTPNNPNDNPPIVTTPTEYTITFNAAFADGTVVGDKTLKTDKNGIVQGTVPTATKADSTFKGWSLSSTSTATLDFTTYKFTKDTDVYAVFASGGSQVTEYTISFDYGMGSGSPASAQTVNGKLESLPDPTAPANYTFDAWYTGADGGGTKVTTSTAFTQNGTIYAHYTENGGGGGEVDYSVDGLYIGSTCYPLTLNPKASRTEYWFGGSKYTFTEGSTMSIYMNGQLISAYVESSSEGIDKSNTESEQTTFTVTLTGEFAIYLHRNDSDWSVEFAGPTDFGGENQLPGGTPFTLTGSDGNSVTIYIRDESGQDVTNLGNYKLWAWNDNGNFFSDWDARPTIDTTMTTTEALGAKCNVIITWDGKQTGNFNGLEAGNTYVITIAVDGGTIAKVEV